MGHSMSDFVVDFRFNDDRDYGDPPFYITNWPVEEFSACNRKALLDEFLAVKQQCNVILEIGVARNGLSSSTHIFLDNKRPDAYYFGVDVDDKSFIDDKENRIHTFKIDSSMIDDILCNIERISGQRTIDFLFIDGFHSVNQVLLDWRFTEYLGSGVVGLHDTNRHPGPSRLVWAIDRSKWDVREYCNVDDHGICFMRRKISEHES